MMNQMSVTFSIPAQTHPQRPLGGILTCTTLENRHLIRVKERYQPRTLEHDILAGRNRKLWSQMLGTDLGKDALNEQNSSDTLCIGHVVLGLATDC